MCHPLLEITWDGIWQHSHPERSQEGIWAHWIVSRYILLFCCLIICLLTLALLCYIQRDMITLTTAVACLCHLKYIFILFVGSSWVVTGIGSMCMLMLWNFCIIYLSCVREPVKRINQPKWHATRPITIRLSDSGGVGTLSKFRLLRSDRTSALASLISSKFPAIFYLKTSTCRALEAS